MKKDWIQNIPIYNYIKNEDFQKSKIDKFFNNYSIHDSYLIDFKINGIDELIIIIQIDPYWSKEFLTYQTSEIKYWPYVILNFFGVNEVKAIFANHSMQLGFSGADFEVIDERIKVYLHGTYGDEFTLQADNKLFVLCFDWKYNIINLKEL